MLADPDFKARLDAALRSNMPSGEIARQFKIKASNVRIYRKRLDVGGLRHDRVNPTR